MLLSSLSRRVEVKDFRNLCAFLLSDLSGAIGQADYTDHKLCGPSFSAAVCTQSQKDPVSVT